MALSIQPYKGARDFYPEDKRVQKYMFGVIRNALERYGYEEYDAPILEPTELYLSKGNEEIIREQTYSFTDRGGRNVTVRTEMTPTVSRMVAAKRQQLSYPLRWYSIPNCWRYERMQRGRGREFYQLNVDIFGVKSPQAELELISGVVDIMAGFKADPTMYEIRLNNRALVDFLLSDHLGFSEVEANQLKNLIDRMAKMDHSDFIDKVDEIVSAHAKETGVVEKLMSLLAVKQLAELPAEVKEQLAYTELAELLQLLKAAGINNSRFDISLMRGFDYYTGIVFEVFDANPENNRSMAGGGRYDSLIGQFGVESISTAGYAMGDITLLNFLQSNKLLPELQPETEIYVAITGDVINRATPAIKQLRQAGLNVAVDLSGRKLRDQIKTADKKGVDKVLIIGESELDSGQYTLKALSSGQESKLTIQQLCEQLTTL